MTQTTDAPIKDLIAKVNAMPDGDWVVAEIYSPSDEGSGIRELDYKDWLKVGDLKALVQRLEQANKVIEQVGRECADIREGIRQGKVDVPIADNSFYAIEELIIEELIAELYR